MQRGLKHNYSYSFSSHLLGWLLKQNKQRNQFDFKGCLCVCVCDGEGGKKNEEEEETLQITVPIDFHYLLCELPSVWTSSLRECEREKVRKMGGGGGVKKSSGSKSRGWLFLIQPCVTLIRQCIMPLIRSMAQATPKWYSPHWNVHKAW